MSSTQAATTAPAVDALVAVLGDALRALADAGRSEQANRLAGRAYVALRGEHPRQAGRVNALMHVLARIPNEQGAADVSHRPPA